MNTRIGMVRLVVLVGSCALGLYFGARSTSMVQPESASPSQSVLPKAAQNEALAARSVAPLADTPGAASWSAAMRTRASVAPRTDWPELPAEDLPVKSLVPLLKARAAQGDGSAACRLAGELLRCRQRGWKAWDTARSEQVSTSRERLCLGLDSSETALMMPMLRQAALAGNLAAIEEYASGNAFELEPEQTAAILEQYRVEAPRLVASGLKAGSVRLLYELQNAHGIGGGTSWLARALDAKNDPRLVAELQMLRVLVMGSNARGDESQAQRLAYLRESLAPSLGADYAASEALALQRFRDWFGARAQRFASGGLGLTHLKPDSQSLNQRCASTDVAEPLAPIPPDWLNPKPAGAESP